MFYNTDSYLTCISSVCMNDSCSLKVSAACAFKRHSISFIEEYTFNKKIEFYHAHSISWCINIAHFIQEPGIDRLSLGNPKDPYQPVTFTLKTAIGSHYLQSLTSPSYPELPADSFPLLTLATSSNFLKAGWLLAKSLYHSRFLYREAFPLPVTLPPFPIRSIAPIFSLSGLGLSKI